MSIIDELGKEYVAFIMGSYADKMFHALSPLMREVRGTIVEEVLPAIVGKVGEAYVAFIKHPTDKNYNVFVISPEPLEVHRKLGIK